MYTTGGTFNARQVCYALPMPPLYRPPFATIHRATFEARPNRFIVLCRLADGETIRAFLPNPGRLQELLLPGVEVYVVPASVTEKRKTGYTMVGVAGEHHPIFLHTHVNNDVARHLLEAGKVPGLEGARIVRAEVPLGHSRFDFLLEHGGESVYLEVKSCTLFGNRVAMFPDAVTARGRRHLGELSALSKSGVRTAVLFIVHSGRVRWFMPDYHTDLAFSRTLLEVRHDIDIIPLSVSWRADFRLGSAVRRVPIPWAHIGREMGDRGNFLLLCRDTPTRGDFHLYTGWCAAGLFSLLGRLSKRAPVGSQVILESFALVCSVDCQRAIAAALRRHFAAGDGGSAGTDGLLHHVAVSPTDPRHDREFHRILARFRMSVSPESQNGTSPAHGGEKGGRMA